MNTPRTQNIVNGPITDGFETRSDSKLTGNKRLKKMQRFFICVSTLTLVTAGQNAQDWKPTQCPTACHCGLQASEFRNGVKLRTVDCVNRDLWSVPSSLANNTQALYASHNHIHRNLWILDKLKDLEELDLSVNRMYETSLTQFHLPKLRVIDLSHNQLDYIDMQAFSGFGNLSNLVLSSNKLEVMHKQAFAGLSLLDTLDLSHNRISDIDKNWFQDLTSLAVLNLAQNNIHILQPHTFESLAALREIFLQGNLIKHISPGSFTKLLNLETMDISNNHIASVPTRALQDVNTINNLFLNGNHITKLSSGSFHNTNISHISLNNMPTLKLVDYRSFSNLPGTLSLTMDYNTALSYIDIDAFHNVPNLHTLSLNHNSLRVLEEEVLIPLRSLRHLDVSENPFICDCAVAWVWKSRNKNYSVETTGSDPCIYGHNKTIKSSSTRQKPLKPCKPMILPFFPTLNVYLVGQKAQFDCRAVGKPKPQVAWFMMLKNKKMVKLPVTSPSSASGHVTVDHTGTLNVDFTIVSDQGAYKCVAENSHGKTLRTAVIRVTNPDVHVIVMHVDAKSITVTWANTHHAHDYELLYGDLTLNATHREVPIQRYMRSYTLSSLNPSTVYEICIAVRHSEKILPINCTSVTTQSANYKDFVYIDIRNYIIGGAIAFSVFVFISATVSGYCVRRQQIRRRREEELYGDNLSQMIMSSVDSLSDLTPTTFENKAAQYFDDDDIEDIRASVAEARSASL